MKYLKTNLGTNHDVKRIHGLPVKFINLDNLHILIHEYGNVFPKLVLTDSEINEVYEASMDSNKILSDEIALKYINHLNKLLVTIEDSNEIKNLYRYLQYLKKLHDTIDFSTQYEKRNKSGIAVHTTPSLTYIINKTGVSHIFDINHPRFQNVRHLTNLKIIKPNKSFLAGGAIRSILDHQIPNDYDIFVPCYENFIDIIKQLNKSHVFKLSRFNISRTTNDMTKMGINTSIEQTIFNSSDEDRLKNNLTTMEVVNYVPKTLLYKNLNINIIYMPNIKLTRKYLITDIFDTFDFKLNKMGFDGEKFYIDLGAVHDFDNKEITLTDSFKYPKNVIKRISKYGSYGYTVKESSIVSLINYINEIDMRDMPESIY